MEDFKECEAEATDADMEDNATEEIDDDMFESDTNHSRTLVDETLVNGIPVNGEEDMGDIDFNNMTISDITKHHFQDVGVAFSFYNWYARLNGFSARKSKLRRKLVSEKLEKILGVDVKRNVISPLIMIVGDGLLCISIMYTITS